MAPGPPNLGDNRFALLASDPQSKRKKPKKNFEHFPNLPKIETSNPKYVVISAVDENKPLKSYSCFAIHAALKLISKEIVKITEFRDGSLCLLLKDKPTAEKFIRTKFLHGVCEVKAKYHDQLNHTKGTIYAPCLNVLNEEEIVKNLSDQGVVEVYKFSKVVNGKPKHSGVCLLTFDKFHLPNRVDITWHSVIVRPYFPSPMRCKNCGKLNHTAKRCNNPQMCDQCNLPPHSPDICSRTMCTNCAGDHPASDKSCPMYQQSNEILKIQVENKCTMKEAITLYRNQIPSIIGGPSFASITKNVNSINNQQQSSTLVSHDYSNTNNFTTVVTQQLNSNLANISQQQNSAQNRNDDNSLNSILTQIITNQQHTDNTASFFTNENISQQSNALKAKNIINNDNQF